MRCSGQTRQPLDRLLQPDQVPKGPVLHEDALQGIPDEDKLVF